MAMISIRAMFGSRPAAASSLAIVALWAASAAAQEIPWRYDYAEARRQASESRRPLFVDFGTEGCMWCRKLEVTSFRNADVVRLLTERFVVLKVDAQAEEALAQAMGVHTYPTMVFAGPDGNILGSQEGFLEADALRRLLDRTLDDVNQTEADRRPAPAKKVATKEAVVAMKPAPVKPPVVTEEVRQAREQLARAREEFHAKRYAVCLAQCRALTADHHDLDEAAEAGRLAARIKNDPERAERATQTLTALLGDVYLAMADRALREGYAREAADDFERVLQACPGTNQARIAQERLSDLRDGDDLPRGDSRDGDAP